jgi:hypothetical protein
MTISINKWFLHLELLYSEWAMTATQRLQRPKTKQLHSVAHFLILIFLSWGPDICFEVFQTVPSTQTLRTAGTYYTKAHDDTSSNRRLLLVHDVISSLTWNSQDFSLSLHCDVNLYRFHDAVCLAEYMRPNVVIKWIRKKPGRTWRNSGSISEFSWGN